LRTLIIDAPGAITTDLDSPEWSNAPLVTPRHAVRMAWNAEAVRKHCKRTHQQLIVCYARDTIGGRELTLSEQHAVVARATKSSSRKGNLLPEKIEIARGMKVMVTYNLETDLDITNSARGEIVDIVLHPEEPPIGEGPVVTLSRLPAFILVRLARTRIGQLEGLNESVIPLEPTTSNMQIQIQQNNKTFRKTVQRTQFPLTAAYAFTDYRSQGQTIPHVIVDIKTPPRPGTLSLFNLYVALSRSSGRSTIRLLRDFDDKVFLQGHDPDLLAEDMRLEELDRLTTEWWRGMQGRPEVQES
jgi:hypothetical protein